MLPPFFTKVQLSGIEPLVKTLFELLYKLENGVSSEGLGLLWPASSYEVSRASKSSSTCQRHHPARKRPMGQGGIVPPLSGLQPHPAFCKIVTWGGVQSLRGSIPPPPFELVCTKPAAIITEFCFISLAVSNFHITVC